VTLAAIDHVVIAVGDLDRAAIAWERLGFTLTPRGRHLGQGTGNACIMFPRDYLELLGVVDPAQASADVAQRREGPHALAFAAPPGADIAASLRARGLHPGAPRALARQLELPEGAVLPRFELVSLPPEETPALSAFICRHLTPELMRRPAWLAHANGARGLRGVTVMVEATAPLRAAYEQLFGAAVTMTDEIMTVHAGPHRIVFAAPDDLAALYPETALDFTRRPPGLVAVTVTSGDLERTADHLAQWQVAHEELAGGTIIVPPAEASGTMLIFVGE
jgi:catechol 2,3-dioxygenase-like lactoylglutathione lyase family enzyme